MKKTIIILTAVAFLVFSACKSSSTKNEQASNTNSTQSKSVANEQTFNLDTLSLKSGETFYQCVMDHEIISDKPGSCPTCGMDLSEIKKQ